MSSTLSSLITGALKGGDSHDEAGVDQSTVPAESSSSASTADVVSAAAAAAAAAEAAEANFSMKAADASPSVPEAELQKQFKALAKTLTKPQGIPCLRLASATSTSLKISWDSPSWQIICDSAIASAMQSMYNIVSPEVASNLSVEMVYQLRYFKTGHTLASWTKVNSEQNPIVHDLAYTVKSGLLANTNYTFEARACIRIALTDSNGVVPASVSSVIAANEAGADSSLQVTTHNGGEASQSTKKSSAELSCKGSWTDWSVSRTENMITRTVEDDEHDAHEERLRAFLDRTLSPYPLTVIEDTNWLKAERVGGGTLQMVSKIPFLGDYGKFVKAAKVIWDARHVGLAALIFADDLQKIAAVLATLASSVKSDTGLTTKDITVGAYYLLWLRRGERAANPNCEQEDHSMGQPGVLLERAPSGMMKELAWFAPLAFASYERTPDRVQWLVDKHPRRRTFSSSGIFRTGRGASLEDYGERDSSQKGEDQVPSGFSLIASSPLASKVTTQRVRPTSSSAAASGKTPDERQSDSSFTRFSGAAPNIYKPAYNLMAHREMGVAVFSVRGTSSFEDVIVDASATAVVDVEFCGVSGTCHGGILSSAIWLAEEARVLSWMKRLTSEGGCSRVVFTGHSLGAGVALLLALMLKTNHPEIKDITVYGYAMPAVVDESIADTLCDGRRGISPADGVVVRCLVNRDDIVSRLSLSNARNLANEILKRRPHWEPLLGSDLNGVYERAKTLWAPNQRRSWNEVEVEKKDSRSEGGEETAGSKGVSAKDIILETRSSEGGDPHSAAASKISPDGKPPGQDQDPLIHASKRRRSESGGKTNFAPDSTSSLFKMNELRQPTTDDVLSRNTEKARLVVPGAICHMYNWRGQTRCALVDHRFKSLRRIEAFQTCVRDHLRSNMLNSMREVFEARKLEARGMAMPPEWERMSARPGDEVCCCVCGFHVTWALTGKAATETARATHHCRACGKIVCKDCSSSKMSIPKYAILSEQRVCDVCAGRGCLDSFVDMGPMPEMWCGSISSQSSREDHMFDNRKKYDEEGSEEEEGSDLDDDMWEDAK